jgi:hypothetical protein
MLTSSARKTRRPFCLSFCIDTAIPVMVDTSSKMSYIATGHELYLISSIELDDCRSIISKCVTFFLLKKTEKESKIKNG